MRLHQELVLGVGGVRAIRALGLAPAVWHLNEGHSAFLLAERARELVATGATLDKALDEGPPDERLHDPHARSPPGTSGSRPTSSGGSPGRFSTATAGRRPAACPSSACLELGRGVDNDPNVFDMTAFSLRQTNGANAVSQLHAETANGTWNGVIDRPILGITNGVHGPTWVGRAMADALPALSSKRISTTSTRRPNGAGSGSG